MFCRNCGQKLQEDSIFCNSCGKKLEYHSNTKEYGKPRKSIVLICVFSVVALVDIICGLILILYSINERENYIRRNNSVFFGLYEQDGDESNGREPIEWIVLDDDGDKMLLISKYIIDAESVYFGAGTGWSNSTIREWLNEKFYKNAFSISEREMIIETDLKTPDCSFEDSTNGVDTRDKVFLLSVEEVRRYFYFHQIEEEYKYGYSSELIATPTTYAQQNYIKDLSPVGSGDDICNEWVLRTRKNEYSLCEVDNEGGLSWGEYLSSVWGLNDSGIRPAMWIKK